MSDLITWHAPYAGWSLVAGLFLVGFCLILIGLRRQFVAAGDPLCPKCGYDMRYSPTRTCGECGLSRDHGLWLPRRWLLAATGVAIAVSLPAFAVQRDVRRFGWDYLRSAGPVWLVVPYRKLQSAQQGGYRLAAVVDRRDLIDRNREFTQYAVLKGPDNDRWTMADDHVFLGWSDDQVNYSRSENPCHREPHIALPPTYDLDDDGIPEAIVQHHLMGMLAQTYVQIITLGAHLRVWSPEESSLPHLFGAGLNDVQIDHFFKADNGKVVAVTLDDAPLFCFHTSHVDSALPEVMLQFNAGKFVVSPDDMRGPLPPDAALQAVVNVCRYSKAFHYNSNAYDDFFTPLQQMMVDLIYSGNADVAYQLLDRAWPGTLQEKAAYTRDFQTALRGSIYWPALRELGHPPVNSPSSVAPAHGLPVARHANRRDWSTPADGSSDQK